MDDKALVVPKIRVEPQQSVLRGLLRELASNVAVDGIILDGSFARGDDRPDSDLDLYVVLVPGADPLPLQDRFFREGVQVDFHQNDARAVDERMLERPMRIYRHVYGRILLDRSGSTSRLAELARQRLQEHRTSPEYASTLCGFLMGARSKMAGNLAPDDALVKGWSAARSEMLVSEALFAANHQLLPPTSVLLRYLGQLAQPPDLPDRLRQWFVDEDPHERLKAAVDLVDWCLEVLTPLASGAESGSRDP